METRTVEIGAAHVGVEDVDAVARSCAAVVLGSSARRRVERSHAFLLDLIRRDVPAYGLSTGCGPLSTYGVPPERREEFQRNLIRSHAVTLGAPLPSTFVRAAMTVRAQVLAQGFSGVEPAAVEILIGMLNAGVHPVVREVGGVGASGDLVELAQIALALIGEGEVEHRGEVAGSARVLREAGLEPLVPRYREGLALMNGTSFHTGAAAVLVCRARRISAAGEIAAAMVFDVLRGNLEALDSALHAHRPHAGQGAVAAHVAHVVRDSALVRRDAVAAASRQDAYTLRCIAQVLGPVREALAHVNDIVGTEIGSVSDNPVFLADEDRVVHGGNFHGQPVGLAIDHLKTAMVELGVMAERRIARILDPQLNGGLPAFLIRDAAGVQSGFMGLQYCASSMAADNAVLVAPASVRSVPTNANNQDLVSMSMVAARQAARVLDNVERLVAIELLCAAQAVDLRGAVHAGEGTRAAHALIRNHTSALTVDRPLTTDVESMCALIDADALPTVVA